MRRARLKLPSVNVRKQGLDCMSSMERSGYPCILDWSHVISRFHIVYATPISSAWQLKPLRASTPGTSKTSPTPPYASWAESQASGATAQPLMRVEASRSILTGPGFRDGKAAMPSIDQWLIFVSGFFKDAHLTLNNAAEIIGKVQPDLSVKVLQAMDFGSNIDFNAVEAVVDATHRYKEIFYNAD
ncbi:MAG: hypothetical protein Q9170_001556 [Blastenia crenularia]